MTPLGLAETCLSTPSFSNPSTPDLMKPTIETYGRYTIERTGPDCDGFFWAHIRSSRARSTPAIYMSRVESEVDAKVERWKSAHKPIK